MKWHPTRQTDGLWDVSSRPWLRLSFVFVLMGEVFLFLNYMTHMIDSLTNMAEVHFEMLSISISN